MVEKSVILWFRSDLRLTDNAAVAAAIATGLPIAPCFIYGPDEEGSFAPGAASRWWLHQSLAALDADLQARGSRLIIGSGAASDILPKLCDATGASRIFATRSFVPDLASRDRAIAQQFPELEFNSFDGGLLVPPTAVRNGSGAPYQVFTPFLKAWKAALNPKQPTPAPPLLRGPAQWPASTPLADLKLLRGLKQAAEFAQIWSPGETAGRARLDAFLKTGARDYALGRDRVDQQGTSMLSPHLRSGELSANEVVWRLSQTLSGTWRDTKFVSELAWREFSAHLLWHEPQLAREPMRPEFRAFPYMNDEQLLGAWQRGETGYPVVDAAMRQLARSGWMHNRARMITASFLVKDLLVDWRHGAAWFWESLVDADLANNSIAWQWVAGCGPDAAPFFRIFNPVTQGEKFDPDGSFVRKWAPELAQLPTEWIQRPWEAPARVLADADVRLGTNYPEPIVNHKIAREVALEAYGKTKHRMA